MEKEVKYLDIGDAHTVAEIRHIQNDDGTMKELFRGTQSECLAFMKGIDYMSQRIIDEERERRGAA